MNDGLTILPYDLPDGELLNPMDSGGGARVFVPGRELVVIGKGSNPSIELHEDAILRDRIPVLRRGSGGCAVVLSPQMMCASFAVYGTEQRKSSEYFHEFNGIIIRALAEEQAAGLSEAGTSDIVRRDRKIAGSALYRNRLMVFYHAVINLADGTDLMERYLKLPPRTPAYRDGRAHHAFVTSLAAEGFDVDPAALKSALEAGFAGFMEKARAL